MNRKLLLMLPFCLAAGLLAAEECDVKEMKRKELCNSIPLPKCSRGLYVDVGLIAQQMVIAGTEVAVYATVEQKSIGVGPIESVNIDQVIKTNFDLDVGLKIGVGYDVNHDNWMAKANFEWLSSTGRANSTAAGGATIVPFGTRIWQYDEDDLAYSQLAATLKVDYYLLDVVLSKGSYFSKNFSYEPFGGIKASWIRYRSNQVFTPADGGLPHGTVYLISNDVDFWGVGPMLGVGSNYYVVAGWSIFSGANVSVLLGEFNLNDRRRFNPTGDGDSPENTLESMVVLSPTLRAMLGLQYDMGGYNENQHVTFRIGFDGRYYFNQYPIIKFIDASAGNWWPNTQNNSFGMIGLVADLGWYF